MGPSLLSVGVYVCMAYTNIEEYTTTTITVNLFVEHEEAVQIKYSCDLPF